MKMRSVATCQECGAQTPRWVGRCPECGTWGSVIEESAGPGGAPAQVRAETRPLLEQRAGAAHRFPTHIDEIDRVLGGGLVRGSVVLFAGEPGTGKSTLALQSALALAPERTVLLVCGEEAPEQVRARAERLGPIPERVRTLGSSSLPAVQRVLEEESADVVVVDSVQSLHDPEIASAPGSVAQVRECGAALAHAAREHGITVILVGHVTKEGAVAGPRVLEHLVDVVLTFEGDRTGGIRILRALKNRFGSTDEVGLFEMTGGGLVAIRDASRYLLADRSTGSPGSVLAACVEGRRPLVLEIQALVAGTTMAMPRRTALGLEGARLPVLLAVLDRRLRVSFAECDVFVSAVGGIRVQEPAADLPTALAVLSSWREAALPGDVAAFGEIGLTGEVRQVGGADRRLAEARSLGCRAALVPWNTAADPCGLELIRVWHVQDALRWVDQAGLRTK